MIVPALAATKKVELHVAELSAQQPWIVDDRLPRHVAIIMDGNGRWAQKRGLPRAIGHRMGVEAVRRAVKAAMDIGLAHLTLYSFSSENWNRPAAEVSDLMGLMKRFIRRDLAEFHVSGVSLRVIGSRDGVDPELVALIDEAEQLTRNNDRLKLIVAFNYGSRQEIVGAARRMAQAVLDGQMSVSDIDEAALSAQLHTSGLPDPELLIRTSGEQRISNFLLWQSAYTEFVFEDTHWPDFSKRHLMDAIDVYRTRDRRFGGLSKQSSA